MNPELRARVAQLIVPGINPRVAALMAWGEHENEPLDPWLFDDAAVLLRAEHLVLGGMDVQTALATARAECVPWAKEDV